MKRKLLSALTGVALGLSFGAPASASLSDELNGMLDGMMTNVTDPGTFETQRRGGISGGSIVARSRIMNVRPITIIAPSASAGCSGIDMFGGTFSYVNSDQLISLLRSVASNAQGYAFSLALDSICTSCMANIKYLQDKIQQLNQFSMNSCEMAQGVVNDTLAAITKTENKRSASILQDVSDFGDAWKSFWDTTNPHKDAVQTAPEAVAELVTGNLVWRALNRQNAQAWFTYGDNNMLESVMSVTGTVIVDMVELSDGSQVPQAVPRPQVMSLAHIVAGGEGLPIYQCLDSDGENGCLNMDTGPTTFKGLKVRIEEMLLDAIPKMRVFEQQDPTAAQVSLLTSLPAPYGQMIYRLVVLDEEAAKRFSSEISESLALDMARGLLDEITQATLAALATLDSAHTKTAIDDVKRVRHELSEEYKRLATTYNLLDNMQKYERWMELIRTSEDELDEKTKTLFDKPPAEPGL